jgi:hypothetical protein
MLIHELTLNQNAGSNDDGLQVESGENWLRLLLKEGSSVLDHTQGTQNNKDSQDKSKSIYPSIVSLSNTGGSFNAPSDECYICIDLDGNFLAIKDMRSPVHTTVSTESQLGILRKNSDNWEILPRRQLRILNTGDKICTSVVDGKPDFPDGQVLKYKSREKTNAISNLDIGSPQALLTQPLEEDHDEIDDDDDDKTVKFEASQAPSKPTSIELITQPEEDNCSDDGGVDEERDDSKRDALKMIMEEKENELPASEVVGGSSKNEIPVYIDTSKENGLKKNGEIESMNLMTQPLREDSSDEETDYDDSEIAKDHDNLSSRRDEIMKAANVVPPKDASDILDTNQVIEEKEEEDGVDRSRGVFSPSMVLFSEDYLGAGEGQKSQGHKTKESLFDSSTQNSPSLLTPVKPVSKDTNVQVETLLTSPKTEYKKLDDEARGSSGLEINPVKDTEDRPKCIALLSPVEGANHKTDDNINGNDGNDSENLLNDSDEEEEDQKKCSEDESYKDLSNVNKKNETIQSHAEDSTTITDQMKANGGEKRDGNKSNSDRKKSQFEVSPEKTNHEDAVDFGNTAPEDEVEEWSETQGINANDCRQTRKTPEKSSENGEVLDQKQRKREQEDDEFAFRDESGQEKVANQGRTAHGAKSTRKRARQSLPAKSNRPNPPLETPTRKKPRQTPATKHLIEEDTPSSTTAPLVGRASRKRTRQNPAMVPSARNNEPVVRVITTGVELSASEKNVRFCRVWIDLLFRCKTNLFLFI